MDLNVRLGAVVLLAALLCVQADPDAKVKDAKDQVARALENDTAAWAEYVTEYGAGSVMNLIAGPLTEMLPEPARANMFERCFKAALREMDQLNKQQEAQGYEGVAYGINSHAHLCQDDFAALRLTGVLHGPKPQNGIDARRKKNRRAGPKAVTVQGRPTPRCSSTTGNVPYSSETFPSNAMKALPTIPEVPAGSTNYSWVGSGVATAVRDQGQCGSCVAFATSVVTEWVLAHRPNTFGSDDLSEDDLMECEPTMWGCKGAWLDTYFASASCRGQGTERSFPYDMRDTNKCYPSTERNNIKAAMQLQWAYIPKTSADLERAVTYAPTQIGIYVASAFRLYKTGIINCDADNSGGYSNHAVTVVGYGESEDKTTPYFLIKNSWGGSWGDQGYLRVRRGCGGYGPCMIHYSAPIAPVL